MITLPTKEIRDRFNDIYDRQEDTWLFPSYRLGFVTVMTKGTFNIDVPMKEPESLTAFNNGCVDAVAYFQGRKEAERSMQVTSTKTSTYKYSSASKEYNPGF